MTEPKPLPERAPQTSTAPATGLAQPKPGEGVDSAHLRQLSPEEQVSELRGRVRQLEESLTKRQDFEKIVLRRRTIGYCVGFVACVLIAFLLYTAYGHFRELAEDPFATLEPPYFWAIVAGHTLVTIAFVLFLYQMVRAAERLILPWQWVEQHPETAKLMLGMTDPASLAAKTASELAESIEQLTDSLKKLK